MHAHDAPALGGRLGPRRHPRRGRLSGPLLVLARTEGAAVRTPLGGVVLVSALDGESGLAEYLSGEGVHPFLAGADPGPERLLIHDLSDIVVVWGFGGTLRYVSVSRRVGPLWAERLYDVRGKGSTHRAVFCEGQANGAVHGEKQRVLSWPNNMPYKYTVNYDGRKSRRGLQAQRFTLVSFRREGWEQMLAVHVFLISTRLSGRGKAELERGFLDLDTTCTSRTLV